MGELLFRVRRFYGWEVREKRDILITILVLSFIFGYNDGQQDFELAHWLLNYIKTLFIVAVTVLVFDAGMKLAALQQGFRAEYRMWPQGLAMGVIIALLTKGRFFLLLPGGLVLHHMMILRLGKFRYGLNTVAQGVIAAAGPVANLILATAALALSAQLNILPGFFSQVAAINLWFLIYQLLPIPKLNGIHIFFMSRLAYVFIFATLLGYVLLVQVDVYSWILAFMIGVVSWFSWYWFFERSVDA